MPFVHSTIVHSTLVCFITPLKYHSAGFGDFVFLLCDARPLGMHSFSLPLGFFLILLFFPTYKQDTYLKSLNVFCLNTIHALTVIPSLYSEETMKRNNLVKKGRREKQSISMYRRNSMVKIFWKKVKSQFWYFNLKLLHFVGLKMRRPITKTFKVQQFLLFYFTDFVGMAWKLSAFTCIPHYFLLAMNLTYTLFPV